MKLICMILFPFLCCVGHPFNYDLHLSTRPGKNGRTMLCFHGYGANYQIADYVKSQKAVDATLVSFNFPDYDLNERDYSHEEATFGTIDELLPALYVLKQIVVDQGVATVDLYGFSAGGAAVVNVIGVLNSSNYEVELKKIGIGAAEKKKLLVAIQKGIVILDAPLKSVEEIVALRGDSEEFEILAENYRKNGLRPIDSVKLLKGLTLNILLHFQKPDEVLSNRDDALFIERLKEANRDGKVTVTIGSDGGHSMPHPLLWRSYKTAVNL